MYAIHDNIVCIVQLPLLDPGLQFHQDCSPRPPSTLHDLCFRSYLSLFSLYISIFLFLSDLNENNGTARKRPVSSSSVSVQRPLK